MLPAGIAAGRAGWGPLAWWSRWLPHLPRGTALCFPHVATARPYLYLGTYRASPGCEVVWAARDANVPLPVLSWGSPIPGRKTPLCGVSRSSRVRTSPWIRPSVRGLCADEWCRRLSRLRPGPDRCGLHVAVARPCPRAGTSHVPPGCAAVRAALDASGLRPAFPWGSPCSRNVRPPVVSHSSSDYASPRRLCLGRLLRRKPLPRTAD